MPLTSDDIEKELKRLKVDLTKQLSANEDTFQKLITIMGNVPELLKDIAEIPDKLAKSIKSDFGTSTTGLLGAYEDIRNVYGDLSTLEANRQTAAGAAMGRLDTISNAMYQKQVEIDGVMMSSEALFEQRLGAHTNYLYKNFEQGEAVKLVEDAQKNLNAQYAKQINSMDSITMIKIPAYTKGMNMSAEEVGEVMRISILRTGRASTEMLDEIAAYSKAISRKTGIPMSFLNKAIASVTTNMKLYGDVSVDEAARIAANVTQLGLKFEALNETQQKFGKFSSSAEHIGKISQITGVQLDAQRISFLSATGKMDEALIYMKDQFKNQGFTKEDFQGMTLPLRNAMSDAMIGGQEGVMNLLDMKKPFEDIAAITAKTDTSKGFSAVTDNLNQIARFADPVEKSLERIRKRALLPAGKAAHLAAQNVGMLKDALGEIDLPASMKKQGMALQTEFLQGTSDMSVTITKHVKKIAKEQAETMLQVMATPQGAWSKDMADHYAKSGGQSTSRRGWSQDSNSEYDVDPEAQFKAQGAYISTSITDANRPMIIEVQKLVTYGQTNAKIQAEKDAAYKAAIDAHSLRLKEGYKLNLQLEIKDANTGKISKEELTLIKDARHQLTGQRIGNTMVTVAASNPTTP